MAGRTPGGSPTSEGGELALNGVLRRAAATRVLHHGFTSLWVSNHGGRQLETSVPTIDALPGISHLLQDP